MIEPIGDDGCVELMVLVGGQNFGGREDSAMDGASGGRGPTGPTACGELRKMNVPECTSPFALMYVPFAS